MSTHRKLSSVTLLAIIMLTICFIFTHPAVAQIDQTTSNLQAANTAVNQAFNAVSDAEKAGANVTNLLTQLNSATGILAQAENSYRTGDFNTAATQADSVIPIAQQVTTAAQNAKQTASVSSQNGFRYSISLTLISAFVFVLVLFLVWRRLRRGYIKNLYEGKPELISQ
jgi:predicted PurR-regulated permease PerM